MPALVYSRRVQDKVVLSLKGSAKWVLSLFRTLMLY
jgi:hypothetical protein